MVNIMGDSSYRKLKWNVKGIFDNIPVIEKALENRSNQLPDHLREKKKITNWINQIKKMNDNIENIKKSKLPELERNINYTFAEPDSHSNPKDAYMETSILILEMLYSNLILLALREKVDIIEYPMMREALSMTDSSLHSLILIKPEYKYNSS